MPRDLLGALAAEHEASKRGVRNQRCRSYGIRGFFVRLVVFARNGAAALVARNHSETVCFMPKKDMANLFHQGGPVSPASVRRIQNHDAPTVRQWISARSARPLVGGFAQ